MFSFKKLFFAFLVYLNYFMGSTFNVCDRNVHVEFNHFEENELVDLFDIVGKTLRVN